LHERIVMSLATRIGPRAPILEERPEAAALVELPSFFLYPEGLERLRRGPLRSARLDATFPATDGPAGLRRACARLGEEAVHAVRAGAGLLGMSDSGAGFEHVPLPAILARGALHHRP